MLCAYINVYGLYNVKVNYFDRFLTCKTSECTGLIISGAIQLL